MRPHPLQVARLALGGALVLWPRRALALCRSDPADRLAAGALRVLGARHIAQALVYGRGGRPGALIDGMHALTAAGVAASDPSRRGVALVNAVTASTFAVAGMRGHSDRCVRRSTLRTPSASGGGAPA